jgi:hypothetical protein
MTKMNAFKRSIDLVNPSGTMPDDDERRKLYEAAYLNDNSSTCKRNPWSKEFWVKAFPTAKAYFESYKVKQKKEADVGIKKSKVTRAIGKIADGVAAGVKEAGEGTASALNGMIGAINSSASASNAIEQKKADAVQQLADTRLLELLPEGNDRAKLLAAMVSARLADLAK